MKIVFRKELFGDNKDDILAVEVTDNDYYHCQSLHYEVIKDKKYLQKKTKNATFKEYLSLQTKLKNKGLDFKVVNSLRN